MCPSSCLRLTWLLLPCLLLGCGPQGPTKPSKTIDARFAVETAPVALRELTPSLVVTGRLEAAETARCVARVAGPVARVLVAEGRAVKAGDPVVELDATRLRLALASADAAVAKATATADDTTAALARMQALAAERLTSAEDLDTARSRAAVATAELRAAQSARARAQADVDDALITAPIPGIIEHRTVDTGQWLNVGAEVFTIVRRDPLQLRAEVPASFAASLAPNLPVTARLDGAEALAAVVLVGQAATVSTGRVPILARLTQPPPIFRPGSMAELHLRGQPRQALVIPERAVRPTERGLCAYVVVHEKAQERRITIGERTTDGVVEVLAGLKAGETLVVVGADAIREGSAVRLADATPSPAAP